jgi:hypothetical protein
MCSCKTKSGTEHDCAYEKKLYELEEAGIIRKTCSVGEFLFVQSKSQTDQ